MQVSLKSRNENDTIVRHRLVNTLYASHKQSTLGVVCHGIASLAAFGSTRDIVYIYALAAVFVVYLVRMWDFSVYREELSTASEDNPDFANKWEFRYLIGGTSIGVWMGFCAFYSMTTHAFQPPSFIFIGISFGTLVSSIGRNYGSRRLMECVLMTGVVPLAVGLLYLGVQQDNLWYFLVGSIFIPFILVAKTSSREIREIVETNLHNRLEAEDMSVAFNLALNYQPTGMLMLDADGNIAVLNETGRQMLKLPAASDDDELIGAPLEFLFETVRRRFSVTPEVFEPVRIRLRGLLGGLEQKTTIATPDGQYFEFRVNHISDVSENQEAQGAVIVFTDITAQVKSEAEMAKLANLDPLTQTPNRRQWNKLVEDAAHLHRSGERIAICVLDVNRFKLINDTMGQMAGDAAIRQISDRLNDGADKRTIIGRYGGDEFVIAVTHIKSTDDIAVIFDTIFNRINTTYVVHGHSMQIRISGGVYVHKAGRFILSEAFSRADHALRKVKAATTRTWAEFTRNMEMEYQRTVQIKAALREDNIFSSLKMLYQPMHTPTGDSFDCCEALARWSHPELGEVGPAEFIDIAEEIGVIQAVTRAILLKACQDCATWPGTTSVSVNFSALDLAHPDVVAMVKSALTTTGLEPNRLQIEVTETVFVNDFQNMDRTIKALRNLGVKIALDDFGTGYSSLSYLNKLSFDKVKIDRSFIINLARDEQARLLFNGIVKLSKSMQFEVVVEGVETDEQKDMVLASDEVDRIQGYIFSRPQPSQAILDQLNGIIPPPTPSRLITFPEQRKGRQQAS